MKFNRFVLIVSLAGSLAACSVFKKVKVENVDRIFLDYDYNQPINYSTKFEGKIFLEMKTGEQVELPNEKGFKTSSNIDIQNGREKITILSQPTAFDQEKLPITLTVSNKDGFEVLSNDTILINFKAPLSPSFSGGSGGNGTNGANGNGRDNRGDGDHGNHGNHGVNGISSNNFDIWVWRIDSMYYFHVLNKNSLEVFRYQVSGLQDFEFYATGGSGGNGGNGGNGAKGRDGVVSGSSSKQPGNGGNAGDGGNAGNGGNGGNVTVYIHSSATEMQEKIKLFTNGGNPGNVGNPGTAGQGGSSAPGQGLSRPGYNGRKGNFGMNGTRGVTSVLIQDFDPITKK